jgi:hypothetical protein
VLFFSSIAVEWREQVMSATAVNAAALSPFLRRSCSYSLKRASVKTGVAKPPGGDNSSSRRQVDSIASLKKKKSSSQTDVTAGNLVQNRAKIGQLSPAGIPDEKFKTKGANERRP